MARLADILTSPRPGVGTFAYLSGLGTPDGTGGIAFLVFAAIVAAAGAAAYFYRRQVRLTAAATVTARLFDDLCRVHELSDEDRRLLARAATGTTHTSVVFVDPTPLDRLAESSPAEAVACVRLRERLFGA